MGSTVALYPGSDLSQESMGSDHLRNDCRKLVWCPSKPRSIPPWGLVPHPPRTRSASTWVALPPGPYSLGLNHKFCFGSVFGGGGFREGTGKFPYIHPEGRRFQGLCHILHDTWPFLQLQLRHIQAHTPPLQCLWGQQRTGWATKNTQI